MWHTREKTARCVAMCVGQFVQADNRLGCRGRAGNRSSICVRSCVAPESSEHTLVLKMIRTKIRPEPERASLPPPPKQCAPPRASAACRRCDELLERFGHGCFLVLSPLTASARSSRSGLIDRFVGMRDPPHIWFPAIFDVPLVAQRRALLGEAEFQPIYRALLSISK
jgi:hypothetical protein